MKILQEFRQFVQRGNVIDLAVGVIMGTAFNKIVSSLVSNVIMPPIGWLIGGVDFKDLYFTLPAYKVKVGELVDKTLEPAKIKYGEFLQNSFDFVLIAFCVFLIVKGVNELQRRFEAAPPPAEPPPPTPTEKLLIEIRDLLQAQKPGATAKVDAAQEPQI